MLMVVVVGRFVADGHTNCLDKESFPSDGAGRFLFEISYKMNVY